MGLAGVYQDINQPELAFQLLEKADSRLRKEEETSSRNLTLADVLQRMAQLHLSTKNVMKAFGCTQEALEWRKKSLGPYHPDVASSLHSLALLYENSRDFKQAAQAYKEAADIRLMSLSENHPDTANSLSGLGNSYQLLGRKQEALDAYEKALEIRRKLKGIDTATTLNNMAGVYQSMQAYPMAARCLQEALKVYQTSGSTAPRVKEAKKNTTRNLESIQALIQGSGYMNPAGEWTHQEQPYYNDTNGEEFKEEMVVVKRPLPVVQKKKGSKPKRSECLLM